MGLPTNTTTALRCIDGLVSLIALASGVVFIMSVVVLITDNMIFSSVLTINAKQFLVGSTIALCYLLCVATFLALLMLSNGEGN